METSSLPVLRPLRLGELLDQAVRLYRRNFLTFVGIIAVVYIPYSLLQIFFSFLATSSTQAAQSDPQSLFSSPTYWLSLGGTFATFFVYVIFVNGLGTAALTHAISRNYLGQKVGILETYKQLGSVWIKLLLTLLLFGLLTLVAFVWTIVPCVGWLTGPGLLVFLGGVVGELIPSIVVIEKLSESQSISRAWDLTRRRFWWLIGFALIFYLFNLLVVSGPTLLISYLVNLALGSNAGSVSNAMMISSLVSTIGGAVVHLLVLPIQLTAWTLVYFDLRVRTEGFDLALLTIDTSEDAATDLSSLPVAAPARKWLTGDDIGKFIVITLVIGGLYALLFGVLGFAFAGLSALGGG